MEMVEGKGRKTSVVIEGKRLMMIVLFYIWNYRLNSVEDNLRLTEA